eukprot:TRINITY_DN45819_c0_g1_i1.p1 TRINITY_DN45819_c0_g1~~TRINITY_DN45819_c0_g1_i1.p1  ORF type:complete len:308 (-),score=62.59 TRINITY_DN45819_c0_g1_i1:73-933(-)
MLLVGADVVKVPGAHRQELLDKFESLLIETVDEDSWEEPSATTRQFLMELLASRGADNNYSPQEGTRLGYNSEGVYLHEEHLKRFFGLPRSVCSHSLLAAVSQAAPIVRKEGKRELQLSCHIANAVDDDIVGSLRHSVLETAFRRADENSNGLLSKMELSRYLRRVVPALKPRQVDDIILQADLDRNGQINYSEFTQWLERSASEDIRIQLQRCLNDEQDIIRATFRAFDDNGDGLISRKEIERVLLRVCPDMAQAQIAVLYALLDTNNDGKIEYDEFVDFLWKRK